MLILPVYRKWTWRDPPIITLLLILINVVVFLGWQLDDDIRFMQAVIHYDETNMAEVEMPLYEQYLIENNKTFFFGRSSAGVSMLEPPEMVQELYATPEFVASLPGRAATILTPQELDRWRGDHIALKEMLADVTWFNHGFRTAYPRLDNAFSHMFLHGGFEHLFFNMIFLLLVGYVVEQIIGRIRYLVCYLLCGLIPTAIEVAISPGSLIPGIGASGAISGLMGMYAVLFGLRKIRFFFHLVFYFDYITLPAISVLPFWIGKELYQMMAYPDSGVNYLAHAGGLVAGAAIAFALRIRPQALNTEYLEQDETEAQDIDTFHKIAELMAAMEYERAARMVMSVEGWRSNPKMLGVIGAAYEHIENEELRRNAAVALLLFETQDQAMLQFQQLVFNDRRQQGSGLPKALLPGLAPLARRFIGANFLDESQLLIGLLMKVAAEDKRLPDLIYSLALAFRKNDGEEEYERYRAILLKNFPGSDACRAISAIKA